MPYSGSPPTFEQPDLWLSALISKLCPQATTLDNTREVKRCTWGTEKAVAAGVKTPWIPLLRLGEKERVKEGTKRPHFLVLSQLPSLRISFSSGANCPKPSCRGALLRTAAAVSGDAGLGRRSSIKSPVSSDGAETKLSSCLGTRGSDGNNQTPTSDPQAAGLRARSPAARHPPRLQDRFSSRSKAPGFKEKRSEHGPMKV